MVLNISDRTNLNRAGIWELDYNYAFYTDILLVYILQLQRPQSTCKYKMIVLS
jgi:hypothetical protein